MTQTDKKIPKRRDVQQNPMKAPSSSKLVTTNISSTVTRVDSGDGFSSEGGAPDDALELIEFMRTLISGGSRAMVDLCVLSRKAYFAEGIKGSSSIKKVLPSVMKWSGVLKGVYSGSVYGSSIPSKNFKNFAWWVPSDADPSETIGVRSTLISNLRGRKAKGAERFLVLQYEEAPLAFLPLRLTKLMLI